MDSLTGDAVFAGRMVQSAAIPNTLLLLGLTALFLSRLLAFLLGGGLLADLTLAVSQGCCRGRSVDGVDDRQTVDQAEKEWDMRQIKHCYEMSELKEFAFLKPSAAAGDKVSRAKNKLKDIRSMALTKSAMGDASAVAASDAVKPAPAADGEFAGPSQEAPALLAGELLAPTVPSDPAEPKARAKKARPATDGSAGASDDGEPKDALSWAAEKPNKKKKVKPAGGPGTRSASVSPGATGGEDSMETPAPGPPLGGAEGLLISPKAKAKRKVKKAQ